MSNRKIRTRLEVGFAFVIAIAVAFGAFAYSLAMNTEQINLSPVYLSEDLRGNIQTQYMLLQEYLTTTSLDRTEAARLETALSEAHKANADLVARYAVLPQSEKQKSSFAALRTARESYTQPFEEALALSRAGSDESKKQALDINFQIVRPAFTKYLEGADGLVSATRRAAEEQHQIVEAEVAANTVRMFSCLAIAVLLSILTAFFIIRSVTTPLAEAVEVLDQVSEGDLTCRAQVRSGDEIGRVMKALNQLLDNQWNAAGIAERLAEGDLSVHLHTLPERDLLGRALVRMRNNMQASLDMAEKIAEGDLSAQPRLLAESDKLGHMLAKMRDSLRISTEAAEKLAEGQLEVEITPASEKDMPRQALVRIRENLRLSVDVIEKISQGDLAVQVNIGSDSDLLRKALARLVETLREQVQAMGVSVETVSEMGDSMLTGAEQLSHGCNQQMAAAAATTSVISGIRLALQQNVDSYKETDKVAATASEEGKLSGEALNQTVAAMKEVAEKIGLLDEIARKTDLLTLSAAVEAARAGEHGMGFGVLTAELRRLGDRSQTAAADMVRLSMGGVKTAESAGELLARLLPSVGRTAELVRDIAMSSAQQSDGATRVSEAVKELDRAVQESAVTTQQIISTAAELAAQAGILRSKMEFFKLANSSVVEEPLASKTKGAGS